MNKYCTALELFCVMNFVIKIPILTYPKPQFWAVKRCAEQFWAKLHFEDTQAENPEKGLPNEDINVTIISILVLGSKVYPIFQQHRANCGEILLGRQM